ncbi:protein of unknown function [Taphrina deformans PYCC 5710]|uniref:Uncharacterized protein n=1 Tax=Taphrina deformans (strain PYCC 5710 / ATCC 11124 / CBS 356.35 / IMI 108563 / JCM 9778 / NBRC 8474) TaxID=1097556 RepID=S0BE32_TAPDE|nr:protein of unknown function [Taphrina deformans PYCC 5710]|eukprot:CCG81309.1 protein of unknown function [Taphrina deformans PYCC 5710]
MPNITVPTTPQGQRRALRLVGLVKNELKPQFFSTISIPKHAVDTAFFDVERTEPDQDTIMSREAIKANFQQMLVLVATCYMESKLFADWSGRDTTEWHTRTMVKFLTGEHTMLFYYLCSLRVQLGMFCETWDYTELGCWMWQSQDNARVLGLVLFQLVGYTIQHIKNGGSHSFNKPNDVGTNLNNVIIALQDRREYIGKQWKPPVRMWQYKASMETSSNARRPYRLTVDDCRRAFAATSCATMPLPAPLERIP